MSITVPAEIRGVLLPLQSSFLLLPNAAVAEVIGYRKTEPYSESKALPSWIEGSLDWRQHRIPVIAFEGAMEQPTEPPGNRARIAVCNTLNGSAALPFIGIRLKSAPHLVRVTEEVLEPAEGENGKGGFILSSVSVNAQEAWVPNLDYLEKQVLEVIS